MVKGRADPSATDAGESLEGRVGNLQPCKFRKYEEQLCLRAAESGPQT
jgi:hypothetical protein